MKKTYSIRKENSRRFSKESAKEWVTERNLLYRKMGSTNRAEYRYIIGEGRYGVYVRKIR